jgi:glc operon protein GlcG
MRNVVLVMSVLFAAGLFAPGVARAQAAPPATSSVQTITLDGALAVLDVAERQATGLHAPSSLAVVNMAGDLVAFLQMDGARPSGIRLAIGRARAAARNRQPTQALENTINGGRPAAEDAGAIVTQGGVPITVGGAVVGAVGVAGTDRGNDVRIADAAAVAVH